MKKYNCERIYLKLQQFIFKRCGNWSQSVQAMFEVRRNAVELGYQIEERPISRWKKAGLTSVVQQSIETPAKLYWQYRLAWVRSHAGIRHS